MRRELLQLAETYNPAKHRIGGYYVSEKLDGTRCFWDGGLSRGIPTVEVPWASVIDPKTGKRKNKIKPIATGLWSRYGNPIMAPDWFLKSLPACFLDGELWAGRGNFQLCRSICGGDTPDKRFKQIQYAVYSAPRFQDLFQDGEIKNTNIHCTINYAAAWGFVTRQLEKFDGDFLFCPAEDFEHELFWLSNHIETQNDTGTGRHPCFMLRQEQLPLDECEARLRVCEYLDYVLEQGGEGVVIRNPKSLWMPKRHKGLLKYKPFEDAEAVIAGFTSGRETDRGSRLLGRIGALIVDYQGKRLELAGLTDEEREFATPEAVFFAYGHPGEDMPTCFQGKRFKIGQTVTFKYRELTDDGVPKEARFWRPRSVE
jgi:DNA ligase 1